MFAVKFPPFWSISSTSTLAEEAFFKITFTASPQNTGLASNIPTINVEIQRKQTFFTNNLLFIV
jgi:hypothetical protein